jgi:hypothetical protein
LTPSLGAPMPPPGAAATSTTPTSAMEHDVEVA